MATEKVGVYRKYHAPVPTDASGVRLPKSEWVKKRPFRWAARWFGTDGKRYSKSFETRKEAERFAEAQQADVRQGKGDRPTSCCIRAFCKEHRVLTKGSVRDTTLHMQLTTMAMFAGLVGWERDLQKVSSIDVERYRANRLADDGIRPATANKEVKQLRRLFKLAIDRGYLKANPCDGLALTKVGKKRPAYCSPEQFQAIFAATSEALWQAMVAVLYATGIRLREMMHLTWRDIDFVRCELHIARTEADGFVQCWSPKDHDLRTLPLPPQAINLLTAWQPCAPEGCPYVFMDAERWEYYRTEMTAGRWSTHRSLINNVLRRFKTLCKRAGIGKFTIHDLRRSCITNWARKLPIHVTQQLAGHSDIKTTREFYLSVQESDVTKARREQKRLLGDIKPSKPTDPKLTQKPKRRDLPWRRKFQPLMEADEV